nr:hypothetical protein [Brevundimonas diminuta]
MADPIPNDLTPPTPSNLTATERAMRTIDWTTQRLHERGRLKHDEREARAQVYETSAADYARMAERFPSALEFAGLHAMAAKIMRAGD